MRDDSTLTAEPYLAPVHALAPRSSAPAIWTARRITVLVAAYLAALLALVLTKGVHVSSDRYFLILLVPAIALGLTRQYLRDWVPFIALMLAYEFARGGAEWLNADVLGRGPFYMPMIDVDRALFGGSLPPEFVQSWFWSGHVRLFDWVIGSFNKVHFFVPPTLLFVIWLERRPHFIRCATAIVITSFIGAVIFFLFPAAPPWLASEHGLIHVVSINSLQDASNGLPKGSSFIASQIPRNPVAAVPSLHSAYALLTVMIAWTWRRRVGYAFLVYPLVMWFSIVYLGDHYVADILAGVAVALIGWGLAGRLTRPGGALDRLAQGQEEPLRLARSFGGTS
jgi:membrane-associated phospholipid phosphatase